MTRKVNLFGFPVEVYEDDDELRTTLPDAFVCMRVADGPAAMPLSTRQRCNVCGEEVWVSPATLETWHKVPTVPIWCVDCTEVKAGPLAESE